MRNADREIALAVAVNDDFVLSQNLLRSPWIKDEHVPVLMERGHQSASIAYNTALEKTNADFVVFVHQDVFLPSGWIRALRNSILHLNQNDPSWAVLGVIGKDRSGTDHGRVWSTGLRREIGGVVASPIPVVSIDELVIVLRVSSGIRFDEEMHGFHLYGTDIVQNVLSKDLGAYVFDGPCLHNSLPIRRLDRSYWAAHEYLRKKWADRLPIPTSTVPLTNSPWPRVRTHIRFVRKRLMGSIPAGATRLQDPLTRSRELGYERSEPWGVIL